MDMQVPERGFYKHYKHDPNGEPLNYTYEVIGVAKSSEDESFQVIYRPLYESSFLGASNFFSRPLENFMERLTIDGKTFQRFEKIYESGTFHAPTP
jgi:hypothetical protein